MLFLVLLYWGFIVYFVLFNFLEHPFSIDLTYYVEINMINMVPFGTKFEKRSYRTEQMFVIVAQKFQLSFKNLRRTLECRIVNLIREVKTAIVVFKYVYQ